MIYAIDFDGTLCEHKFPDIGKPIEKVIRFCKAAKENKDKLILWTCRDGKTLLEAIEWCRSQGIEFDSVNEDVPDVKASDFGRSKSVKVFADFYVDDRNIVP